MKLLRKKNNHLFLWILFAIAMVLPFAFSGSPFLLLVFCFIEIYIICLLYTSRLSGKPLSVMNREYRLVALSSGWNELEKAGLEVRAVGERLPVEVVNVFKTDPLYLQVAERREPFLYPSNVALPVQVLCTNLFYGDIYCARAVSYTHLRQNAGPPDTGAGAGARRLRDGLDRRAGASPRV